MDSVLNSCSATDFERLSYEKYRIQGLTSTIKASIDNLKDKQLARDKIRNKIKLTPIQLEVFTGQGRYVGIQYSKWLNVFRDLVLNGLFSPSEKLRILRQHLKPPASLLIADVIHGEGFDIALEKLSRTYGQTGYIIADCFQAVNEIEEIGSLDPTKLRAVYSLIKTVIDILKEYGMDINLSPIDASSIYTTLKRKLPTSIFLKFSEKQNLIKSLREPNPENAQEEVDNGSLHESRAAPAKELVAFMKFLDEFTSNSEELAAFQKEKRQRSKQISSNKAQSKQNKSHANDNPLNVFATQAQASTKINENKSRGRADPPCIFCKTKEPNSDISHPARKCKRNLTFGAKAAILRDNDACWIHLAKTNHNSKNCKSKYYCFKCKKL